ncbi:MAG: hypothetical protein AMS18_06920 [Gemmatimonas sp. SG8_17]|nr:MAG: hypothetical protein AMS18_06920 [Gemmatimonas sp. SG8_17]
MRRIALFVPIVVVAGYVIHDSLADNDARAVAPETASPSVVVAAPHPAPPALAVPPRPAQAPHVATAELRAQLAGLADLAVALPATVELDESVLHDLRVHASAKADIAGTIAGLIQIIEQQTDQRLNEDEVLAITGSVLADLAATLEAHLEVAGHEVRVAIPDTSRGR